MVERCPSCGYRFIREEGFGLGAFVVNFAVTEVAMAVVVVAVIVLEAGDRSVSVAALVLAGVVTIVVVPVAFYPFSRTVWAAIELVMRPLEPAEVADAERALSRPPDIRP